MKQISVESARWAVVLAVLASLACGSDDPATPTRPWVPDPGRPTLPQTYSPSGYGPAGDVFVHLFEWGWDDVARECEEHLGPAGYRAVQVSPPQEHIVQSGRPWWERYQPVSYTLQGRSGSPAAFEAMVDRCRAAGVDVYVDAVINHMTAGSGTGTAGTTYTKYSYPGLWEPSDFHPSCGVSDYQDEENVQDCELLGLADLDTGLPHVRTRLAEYLVDLVRIGVAGFRIDAAKHMQPVELDSILDLANDALASEGLPRPYYFAEVIDYGGEAVQARDYFGLAYSSGGVADITEFRYRGFTDKFAGVGGQRLSELGGLSESSWNLMPTNKAVVFVQNHDTQRHGGVTYRDGDLYRLANVWLLAFPYGYPKVMSSYGFDVTSQAGRDMGPPMDGDGTTAAVECAEPFESAGIAEWVCEHRDPDILAMVRFRGVTAGTAVTGWWDNGGNAVAFSRGERGFVAINREPTTVDASIETPLPAGAYCDVLSGGPDGGVCAGRTLTVTAEGRIEVTLEPNTAVAIHVEARP